MTRAGGGAMRKRIGLPLTLIWSPNWMRWPMWAGSLLTEMRPSMMSCSISSREPRPAWASTLCSLGVSACGDSTRLGGGDLGAFLSASNCPETTSAKRMGGAGGAAAALRDAGLARPGAHRRHRRRRASSSESASCSSFGSRASQRVRGAARARLPVGFMLPGFDRLAASVRRTAPGRGWFMRYRLDGLRRIVSCSRSRRLPFDREARLDLDRRRGPSDAAKGGLLAGAIQHGQLVQRFDAQVVEELARRGEQRRTAWRLAVADHLDPAAILQLLEDQRVDGDAADVFHVAARDRLAVGNDRQRLEHGARVLAAASRDAGDRGTRASRAGSGSASRWPRAPVRPRAGSSRSAGPRAAP